MIHFYSFNWKKLIQNCRAQKEDILKGKKRGRSLQVIHAESRAEYEKKYGSVRAKSYPCPRTFERYVSVGTTLSRLVAGGIYLSFNVAECSDGVQLCSGTLYIIPLLACIPFFEKTLLDQLAVVQEAAKQLKYASESEFPSLPLSSYAHSLI